MANDEIKVNTMRVERVSREIHQAIANYFVRGFRGSLSGLVTVTKILMAKDLKSGKVFISVLGSPQQAESSFESIQAHRHEVQGHVGKSLALKFCPRLTFYLDDSFEEGLRIQKLISDTKHEG